MHCALCIYVDGSLQCTHECIPTHKLFCLGGVVVNRVTVELGDTVSLSCPTGVWIRDGHTLTSSSSVLVKDGFLFIFSTQLSDAGEYMCAGQITYLLITGNFCNIPQL